MSSQRSMIIALPWSTKSGRGLSRVQERHLQLLTVLISFRSLLMQISHQAQTKFVSYLNWRPCVADYLIHRRDMLRQSGPFLTASVLQEELNGPKIHRLTLEGSLHDAFDRLDIWLTGIIYSLRDLRGGWWQGEPNKYKLEAADSMLLFTRPEFVTFSSPDSKKLPLPKPAYLHIRATCAKVAHLSGASEYIEKVLRDLSCFFAPSKRKLVDVHHNRRQGLKVESGKRQKQIRFELHSATPYRVQCS